MTKTKVETGEGVRIVGSFQATPVQLVGVAEFLDAKSLCEYELRDLACTALNDARRLALGDTEFEVFRFGEAEDDIVSIRATNKSDGSQDVSLVADDRDIMGLILQEEYPFSHRVALLAGFYMSYLTARYVSLIPDIMKDLQDEESES